MELYYSLPNDVSRKEEDDFPLNYLNDIRQKAQKLWQNFVCQPEIKFLHKFDIFVSIIV